MLELAIEFMKALSTWAINGVQLGLIIGAGYLVVRGVTYILAPLVKEK